MLQELSNSIENNEPIVPMKEQQGLEFLSQPQLQKIQEKVAPTCQETKHILMLS